jgi:hypothetical protein
MSEIRATTISNAAGTGPITMTGQYAAKAWVNFDGTGTVSIWESGNVSSITDNAVGIYTVNFTTAMPDINYSVVSGDWSYGMGWDDTYNTTSIITRRINMSVVYIDSGRVNVVVIR